MEAMPSPTNLPRIGVIAVSLCRNVSPTRIIRPAYNFPPIHAEEDRDTCDLCRASPSPPRHTICITDISRARDLYVLRTTSSSNLKLTDLPAGHKLTHECDDNYSSWYIYTSVCVYIYVHMQVAPTTTARVYLAGRKNSGRGGGTNASRGFTRRDLLPQSAASSRVTSIWPFYLLWKKVSFFFFLFLISRIEKWKF